MSTITTPTDELLLLAETLGDVKARTEKLEGEFLTQAKPLEAAATALQAALAGIKSLQFHVLDNNLGQLSARVEQYRAAINEQVEVIATELKRADADNAQKTGEAATALRSEIAALQDKLGAVVTQFGQELQRVELEAKQKATEFAAIPGAPGPAGKSPRGRGPFQPGRKYEAGDIVSFLGGSYLSNDDSNDEKPGAKAKRWTQLVSRAMGGAPPLESMGGTLQITQGGTGQTSAAAGARALIDGLGTTRGSVLYRGASGWTSLTPGAANTVLKSQGAGADPAFAATTDATAATDAEAAAAVSTTTFITPANAALAALRVANTKTPRGGIAFDGTSGARATSTLTGQAIGTDPFSIALTFQVPTSNPSASRGLFLLGPSATTVGAADNVGGWITSTGQLMIYFRHEAGATNYVAKYLDGFVTAYAGKVVQLVFVRNAAGEPAVYLNGVAQTMSALSGGSWTWQSNVDSVYFTYGTTVDPYVGNIYSASLYNLALSAADCLEIAENGGAVPDRYQFGSQADVKPGSGTIAKWFGTGTISSAGAASFTVDAGASGLAVRNAATAVFFAKTGMKIRYNATVAAGITGNIAISNFALSPSVAISSGTADYEIATTYPGSAYLVFDGLTSGAGGTITINSAKVLGAVCHFACDEGVGYQLHDSSTNKLDAVMTTTGVAHLVPKREGYVRTPSTGISWSGSHEPKNILGAASTQRMLPNEAVITQIVLKASDASTNGASVNSTNTAARWSAVAALSTTKSVRTVANSGLPAGTADADTDILVDPDTVNYTGTIQADVRYCVAEG